MMARPVERSKSSAASRAIAPSATLGYGAVVALVLAIAVLIRLAGISGDLWLDEIWSLDFARAAHSARDIFLSPRFHHDNNHWLNTLYLHLLGPARPAYAYRLLSLFTGTGSVALIWLFARRWGKAAGLCAALFGGFSYLFVHYSTEARGYAPAMFFALASVLILRRFIDSQGSAQKRTERVALVIAFWLCCILGFCSHATFLYPFIATLIWTPIALYRKRTPLSALAVQLVALFLIPFGFFAWLYLIAIRGMTIGGGPSSTIPNLLSETFAWTVGLPPGLIDGWVALALILLISLLGAWTLWRKGSDEAILLLGAGLVAPAIVIAIRHQQLYPRYLILAVPFLCLLASASAQWIWQRSRTGKIAVAIILLSFLTGSAAHLWQFLTFGRGHYSAAIAYIITHTPGPVARVGSNSQLRTTMLIDYYLPRLSVPAKPIEYVPDDAKDPPDWYLYTPGAGDPPVSELIAPQWNATFQLEAEYPYYGLSGWNWQLFRRVP
jgi:4-amino-4-deoxy-L-arabinose transferase-like glycosyltransferase